LELISKSAPMDAYGVTIPFNTGKKTDVIGRRHHFRGETTNRSKKVNCSRAKPVSECDIPRNEGWSIREPGGTFLKRSQTYGDPTMPHTTVNGISMHYETHGDGPPLLFIHGLGSSLRDWEYQIDAFSGRFRVITVDLRGHGRSDKPKGPYSIELFAEDVGAFLKQVVKEPAHVVGLSMGGAVAYHLALDYKHLLRSIVITNMSAVVPVKTFAQKRFYYSRLLISALFGPKRMGKLIAQHVFPKPEMDHLRKTLESRWAENPRRAYLSALKALKNWSVMERLHNITCPVLLIHSEHDYSPLAHKKEVAAHMKQAVLMTLPGTHHVVNVEEPESFNTLVMRFLTEQENE